LGEDPLAQAEALIEAGKAADAVELLAQLHRSGRGGLLLQCTRVWAAIAAGETQSALAIAREAAALYPGIATAAASLGEALLAGGHLATAIGEFQRALRLDPAFVPARYLLGSAWLEAGEADKADEAFAAIAPDEAPPALAAKLAEIDAMRARARSDARYVRHLFDQFSSDYDARMLGQLSYGAPQILRGLADMLGLARRRELAVLDLGCGTGLAGAAFRDLARRLDGIDLSPAMVGKARGRGIYDDVIVGDIETIPAHTDCDLVLAADTLVYLGDLAPAFRAAATALKPGGAFLFTVERKDGEGFELGPKRRWRHSENYLRDQSEAAGFAVTGFLECHPRTEAGTPVEGYAVALTRR
jgi:predicted TPR repeat methyltransferase